MTVLSAIDQIKIKFSNVWLENGFSKTEPVHYLKLLNQVLHKCLRITECEFFLYREGLFIPVTWDQIGKENIIQWETIASCFKEADYSNSLLITDNWGILCRDSNAQPAGLLLFKATDEWDELIQEGEAATFAKLLSRIFISVRDLIFLSREESQYRELFNMTEKFHSSRDTTDILYGILEGVTQSSEHFSAVIILANDTHFTEDQTIQPFYFETERKASVECFVTGKLTVEESEDLNCRFLNVPISGKQGVYGVLRISAPAGYCFSERQKTFFTLLTQTAGSALENAKLYSQTHRLVNDLQLINETTKKLNKNISLKDILSFLQSQLEGEFKPEACVFAVKQKDGTFAVSETSSPYFQTAHSLELIERAVTYFNQSREPLFYADTHRTTGPITPYRSIMVVPLIDNDELLGIGAICHSNPYYFSFDSFKLLQSILSHSVLAISNAMLKDQLQQMADRDHLTGLYSRRYLDRYVESTLQTGKCPMLILIDIDNFKSINDRYGHQKGDQVIQSIASVVKQLAGEHAVSARWGGEELAIYSPDFSLIEGEQLAAALIESIPRATVPSVTASIGLACSDEVQERSFHNLFLEADQALYKAKNSGKNRFYCEGTCLS